MLYQKANIKNGKFTITKSKVISQNKLTSECWLIQLNGLGACTKCEALNTNDCGGQDIRKRLSIQRKQARKLI